MLGDLHVIYICICLFNLFLVIIADQAILLSIWIPHVTSLNTWHLIVGMEQLLNVHHITGSAQIVTKNGICHNHICTKLSKIARFCNMFTLKIVCLLYTCQSQISIMWCNNNWPIYAKLPSIVGFILCGVCLKYFARM